MQPERMRCHLDETRVDHFADLRPRQEVLARHRLAVVFDLRARRCVHPAADQRDDGRVAEQLQRRVDMGVEIGVAIVKGDTERFWWQWRVFLKVGHGCRQRHRLVALFSQVC